MSNVLVERERPTTTGMSDLQHFCLRWNNYQNNITAAFENLRDDEDFIDVTLACDGKSLKAHRVVLSACSPYFKELLKSTPCKHPVIVLQDVSFDDLQALVEFIYHGEVNVQQKNLTSFLKTAEVLKVSGLTQHTSSDGFSDNLSHISSRSPSTPEKTPFHNTPIPNSNQTSSTEDRNSPRHVQHRHRRHIRSPTPIRSSYCREDSPVMLKRAKSVDAPSPLLNHSNSSPSDDSQNRKNLSSPRHCSPISNNNYDENHNDEERSVNNDHDEPPVDFSHPFKKFPPSTMIHLLPNLPPLPSPISSPKDLSMKEEPMDLVSSNNNDADEYDDVSDNSDDRISDNDRDSHIHQNTIVGGEHEDSFPSHLSHFDSKLFTGASFNFSMAAALAADSLAAGFNHQSHTNAANVMLDGFGGSSQGRSFNGSVVCADWMELEQKGQAVTSAAAMAAAVAVHQHQLQHGCFICGKLLSTKLTLKRHIEQQHHQPLHSAVCTICHKVFRTLNSLNNHKSIYHRKPKWNNTSVVTS